MSEHLPYEKISPPMATAQSHSEAKDEALRSLGRNVLQFQEVEQLLKFVLHKGSFRGSLSELRRLVVGEGEFAKRSMGQLIAPFVERHLREAAVPVASPVGATEPYFSCSFSVQLADEDRISFERELGALTEERNNLVHHSLAEFQFDTLAGCSAAIAKMEEQRNRIARVRTRLAEIITMMMEVKEDFAAELKRRGPSIFKTSEHQKCSGGHT